MSKNQEWKYDDKHSGITMILRPISARLPLFKGSLSYVESPVTFSLFRRCIHDISGDLHLPEETDVLIVGAGMMGCSTAFWMKQWNPQSISVTVIERDPIYTNASSVLSVGGIRQQFSICQNVQMSMFGAHFLQNIKQHLSVLEEDPPCANYVKKGYLLLASKEGVQRMQENYRMQTQNNAKVELLSSKQLKERFPWMNTTDVALASHGLDNEGWFDPWLLLKAFRSKAISLGAQFLGGDVCHIGLNEDKTLVEHVTVRQIGSGKKYKIRCKHLVNAGGFDAAHVCRSAGIGSNDSIPELRCPLPVEPRKRFVYVVHCPKGPGEESPFTIDYTGCYLRREGPQTYICGVSPEGHEEPDTSNLEVDYDFFANRVWPLLAHRYHAFEDLKLKTAWAGYYDFNTFDENMIIGKHPHVSNFILCAGFSGHGVQQAPAAGRAVMELIVHGKYLTIDLSQFGFDRIVENRPIRDHCCF